LVSFVHWNETVWNAQAIDRVAFGEEYVEESHEATTIRDIANVANTDPVIGVCWIGVVQRITVFELRQFLHVGFGFGDHREHYRRDVD